MDNHAAQALIRFGLGRRGSEPLPPDPAAWLRSQLAAPDSGPPGPSLADGFAAVRQDRQERPPPGTPRKAGLLAKAEAKARGAGEAVLEGICRLQGGRRLVGLLSAARLFDVQTTARLRAEWLDCLVSALFQEQFSY